MASTHTPRLLHRDFQQTFVPGHGSNTTVSLIIIGNLFILIVTTKPESKESETKYTSRCPDQIVKVPLQGNISEVVTTILEIYLEILILDLASSKKPRLL